MKKKMKFELVPHEEGLQNDLKAPRFAAEYIKAAIAESAADIPDVVLLALRRVAEFRASVGWPTKRESIDKPFTKCFLKTVILLSVTSWRLSKTLECD